MIKILGPSWVPVSSDAFLISNNFLSTQQLSLCNRISNTWETSTIWIGPTDIKFGVNVHSDKFIWASVQIQAENQILDQILTPKIPQFWGLFQITYEIKLCDIRQIVWVNMSSYEPNTKFWTKFGPKKAQNFFKSWYHLNLVNIIVVYHNMQNEKRRIS